SAMRMGVRRLLLAGALLVVATTNAAAQAPTAPPPTQTPPAAQTTPPVVPPVTSPPVTSPQSQVFGKVLSVEDAVAIALDTQPNIKARISDYIAAAFRVDQALAPRSEEHTSELQSRVDLVCRLLLEKKKRKTRRMDYYRTM